MKMMRRRSLLGMLLALPLVPLLHKAGIPTPHTTFVEIMPAFCGRQNALVIDGPSNIVVERSHHGMVTVKEGCHECSYVIYSRGDGNNFLSYGDLAKVNHKVKLVSLDEVIESESDTINVNLG